MSACRDPAIKLFGKTIPLPLVTEDDDMVKDKEQESPNSEGELVNSSDDQESETKDEEEKALKKPDKILACPRCNSMETKFCYYNNYNVNQPRHFCKNCQRYWTAGGTMRNVPVGAGRRKNKNSSAAAAAHYRHLTVAEPAPHPNGTVLSFGSESCQQQPTGPCNSADCLQEPHPLPYMNCSPWPYPWHPMYPATAYWGCGPWSMPWLAPPLASPPAASGVSSSGSGPNSPTLGKHSRDNKQGERCIWTPKTLRMDDPGEAAKSSIWASMGFKNDKAGAEGIFESFGGARKAAGASQLIHANPAAMSRSVNFRESSSA